MPRYFFNTDDGRRHVDDTGVELEDHTLARREAIRHAGKLLSDDPDHLWDGRDFRVEATDQDKTVLFTIVMMAVNSPASGMENARIVKPPEQLKTAVSYPTDHPQPSS